MKLPFFSLFVLAIIALGACTQTVDTETNKAEQNDLDYYQLTKYSYETPDQMALLDTYFADALLPALHRAGVKNIGVFKPIEELSEEVNFFMLLVPYMSLKHFEKIPVQLEKDTEYLQAASAYIDAPHDQAPYLRKESFILRSFSATPRMALPDLSSPRNERVYELRSYEAATDKLYKLKVEMFNEGESALFQELGFNPVMFCEVLSSSHMPHLMYMTTHADTAAQNANWDAFRVHPEWDRMKNLERYQNTVSNITRYQLYPTEYSDY
jgi:hypothetical protein